MNRDPLDPDKTTEYREWKRQQCGPNCLCRQEDAMTTPIDLEDLE